MACKSCGQAAKRSYTMTVDKGKVIQNGHPITHAAATKTTAQINTANPSSDLGIPKIVSRNPFHNNSSIQWISDWHTLLVSLDGKRLDPKEFIYANEGPSKGEDGWVDFISDPIKKSYNAQGQVIDVSTYRKKGKVQVVYHAANVCTDCRARMKEVDWFNADYYTTDHNGTVGAFIYNQEDLKSIKVMMDLHWNNRANHFRT